MTASIPVIEFARELQVSHDKLLRALVLSNLVTIHLKTGIGTLSAYCGAVSAGCGSGAGIAYLYGGDYEVIAHTIVNSLAIVSGIICDGAKAPAQPRFQQQSMPESWAMKCTYRDSSSMAVMESLPTVWKIPSGTWDSWRRKVCAKRIKRLSGLW